MGRSVFKALSHDFQRIATMKDAPMRSGLECDSDSSLLWIANRKAFEFGSQKVAS
jgi:hypothetical protein